MTIPEALSVLELKVPVTHEDIKKAFRRKAKELHPDRHLDPHQQKVASQGFISAKKASDFLLGCTVAQINSGRITPLAEKVVRRPPRTYVRRQPVEELPFVREIDNVARLFRLISPQGKEGKLWKRFRKIRFQPSELIGKWYISLFEKTYPGESNLEGATYAIFRFFKLLFGSISLILGFFGLAIAGLAGMIIFGPPVVLFISFYAVYHSILGYVSKILSKSFKSNNPSIRLSARLKYLIARTFPVTLLLLVCQSLILGSMYIGYYVLTLSWIFALIAVLLSLSIVYEWIQFFKLKKSAI